ncbi:MAG: hypothetical protein GY851_01265 [bacterium]|nr:hypothetical protein [bacterium]
MSEYANVWPRGGLFAFSGIDGETCHSEPFVAAGTLDGIGWDFWLTPRVTFSLHLGERRLEALRGLQDFCFSDCWRCTVSAHECDGQVRGGFVDRASMTFVVDVDESAGESATLTCDAATEDRDGCRVCSGDGWWIAIREDSPTPCRRFSIAISYASEQEAVARAEAAHGSDIDEVVAARLAFYESLDVPESVWNEKRITFYKAAGVMKVNVESAQQDIPCRWTTPDRMPHRHMWLWDSAFHAVGWQHVSVSLAEDAIRAVLSKQTETGQLRLAVQPGVPPQEEQETQPPVVAWAVHDLYEHSERLEFVEEVYPALVRYVEWFETNRKRDNGLYGWSVRTDADPVRGARGGESGMDNSPRFDAIQEITAVDLSCYLAGECLALKRLARALGKRDEAAQWEERRLRIAEAVREELWDDEDRFFYDLDENGHLIPVKTTAGLMALHGRVADRDQAEALRVHMTHSHEFWTPLPLPSVSANEESYSEDMWRGPAWMNINVLLYDALKDNGFLEEAHNLAHRSMTEMARWYLNTGCIYEYYDALGDISPAELPRKGAAGTAGGTGFGVIADYHWSAAAYVYFAYETA